MVEFDPKDSSVKTVTSPVTAIARGPAGSVIYAAPNNRV